MNCRYIKLITIVNLKQWFAILNCKLGNHSNSTENIPMCSNVMAVYLLENLPLLQALVDCFLAVADTLLHSLVFEGVADTSRALHLPWSVGEISIVSFNTLSYIEHLRKKIAEYFKIVVFASWEWPIEPGNPSILNSQTNLIPKGRLSIILMRSKVWAMIRDPHISAINAQ